MQSCVLYLVLVQLYCMSYVHRPAYVNEKTDDVFFEHIIVVRFSISVLTSTSCARYARVAHRGPRINTNRNHFLSVQKTGFLFANITFPIKVCSSPKFYADAADGMRFPVITTHTISCISQLSNIAEQSAHCFPVVSVVYTRRRYPSTHFLAIIHRPD